MGREEPHTPPVPRPSAYALVGLGNPGRRYERNRHNIGFEAVDRLAEKWGVRFRGTLRFAVYGEYETPTHSLLLVKPVMYMNRSGLAAREVCERWKLPPQQVLVIADDINLPLGSIRIRGQGSAGGHNGLKSIIEMLASDQFPRLRIGVGEPGGRGALVEHVLGNFSPAELKSAEEGLAAAVEAVDVFLEQGLEVAMRQFNRKAPATE